MTLDRIILVHKETELEELCHKHGSESHARFYIQSQGKDFNWYKENHLRYQVALSTVRKSVPRTSRFVQVKKNDLPSYQISERDLVVVVGDPGLFVNAARYIKNQPVVMVNSDPKRFEDIFTSCYAQDSKVLIAKALAQEHSVDDLTMIKAITSDGQTLLALNDIKIGKIGEPTAWYQLRHSGKAEFQGSDGVLVTTGSGSSGWYSSVMNSAYRLAGVEFDPTSARFSQTAKYLQFVVMNANVQPNTGSDILSGEVSEYSHLVIESRMAEGGFLYGDGMFNDYLNFPAGVSVSIMPADEVVRLVR